LLQGHQSEGICTLFQPRGDLLVSTSWDGTTRLWDPIRGRLLVTLDGGFHEWLDGGSSLVLTRNHDLIKNQIALGAERRSIDYRMLGDRAGAALYGPARVSFSPAGRYLAASHSDQRVDLWDLSSIRQRLAAVGLADGLPDIFGGADAVSRGAAIGRIEVQGADAVGLKVLAARHTVARGWFNFRSLLEPDLTDPEELLQRDNRWNRLGHHHLAAADYRASLSLRPDSADTANELAWCLVSVPVKGNLLEAVVWARKAVKLAPETSTYQNTLGVALHRAGLFDEAVKVLERNVSRNHADVGYDWVFPAMCKKRLGEDTPARIALTRARQWRAGVSRLAPRLSSEFQAFMREAESPLYGPLPDHLPANVFYRE
jgi:Tfp pilus assembly protein PilF